MIDIASVFGIAGGVLGVIIFFPQIIRAVRTKKTNDIAVWTYILVVSFDTMWSIYGLMIGNLIIAISSIISTGLGSTIIFLKSEYDKNG